MKQLIQIVAFLMFVLLMNDACTGKKDETTHNISLKEYFANNDTGVLAGGVRMIPIQTAKGNFKVWTKKFGNNPRIKILLLHGGPACTHEYMECFESFFPSEGFEFYEYDQLGSYYSDQPTDTSLWVLDRFVEEVEQVRKAIGADKNNFYLLGHSWGGILSMQYALKYQQNMKALIVSNMMASCPDYGKYAENVLSKQMDPAVLKEVRDLEAKQAFSDPRYMELLMPNFYNQHICRLAEWPEPVTRCFKHINNAIYTMMQGPSEFGVGGNLAKWDIKDRLHEITVPTLMIGGKHDTMDPEAMNWQSQQVKNGSYLFCPNGSHMSMWDDQAVYMKGLIGFIHQVDQEAR